MKTYKRHRDYGFFDQDIRLSKLSKLGDPLEKLKIGVDFEIFREFLEGQLVSIAKGKGGRRPYDYVLMFKVIILQRYYNLSDHQVEYQINDRMSFMRFLDLTISDDVPDSRTVWHFRELLTEKDLVGPLFELFLKELEKLNLIVNEGKIVDASFVEVPRQRNSREENKLIKEGQIPESFTGKPRKLSQKDTDARWTKKDFMVFYGYKNHVKIDTGSKFVTNYVVSAASMHDSQALEDLLGEGDKGQVLHADSAYGGENQMETIKKAEMQEQVNEKGTRDHPLTEGQKESNREKSKVRARVEHIFGFMEMSMDGLYLYAIGEKRIKALVGLINLTYNMFRKVQLTVKS